MWIDAFIAFVKIAFFISCVLTLTSLLTWQERKQSAVMQDRLGANRASILGIRAFGLCHILSDALKMFFKEDYVPPGGDKLLHTTAPFISLFCALMAFAAPAGPPRSGPFLVSSGSSFPHPAKIRKRIIS